MRDRFDTGFLDPESPFEIDEDNQPHLYKHVEEIETARWVAVGIEELYDIYVTDTPLFYPAREDGPADWLMVGEVPSLILAVPLAPPRSGDVTQCRPIGIYSAPSLLRKRYLEER
ncbi:MAG: hypothetical protein ACR2MY_15415 [Candidatus Dormibacteria bacterium]